MEKEFFVAAIDHPEFGEVYRFFEVDPATGEEQAVDPFDSGMVKLYHETPPELFYITSKRGGGCERVLPRGAVCRAARLEVCRYDHAKMPEALFKAAGRAVAVGETDAAWPPVLGDGRCGIRIAFDCDGGRDWRLGEGCA